MDEGSPHWHQRGRARSRRMDARLAGMRWGPPAKGYGGGLMAQRGRPPNFSEERANQVLQAIRIGATYELAAAYAGISEDTFSRWRTTKADFAEQVRLAEGQAAIGWLALVEKAAAKDYHAATWK